MHVACFAIAFVVAGCRNTRESRTVQRPPDSPSAGTLTNNVIDYVDTDGFDVVFEAALVNRDPIITIRTQNEKPDWSGRLNAWIAAWNMGKTTGGRVFRGQIPVPTIDGDTLREFRLLVGSVIDRADDASRAGAMWWKEERIRSRRVELLKPYNLRFHIHTDRTIHLIFFHGSYATQYPDFVARLTEHDEPETWSRGLEFSRCKLLRDALQPAATTVPAATVSFSETPDR
jgi:hypothetical protein